MRQHYLPRFYLANFAASETKQTRLSVLDKCDRRQWVSNPKDAAHRRNYYRTDNDAATDPDEIEKQFALLEDKAAPVIRTIIQSTRLPSSDEDRSTLLNFVALMAVRVPGSRSATERVSELMNKQVLRGIVSSRERYESYLKQMRDDGLDVGKGDDFERMREFINRDEYAVGTPQDVTLAMMLYNFSLSLDWFAKRCWTLFVAKPDATDFVTSDRPVTTDWLGASPGSFWGQPGYAMPNSIVRFPLSPRIVLAGVFADIPPVIGVDSEAVAQTNAVTCMCAERFVYSRSKDFSWLHRDRSIQNVARLLAELESEASSTKAT